MTRPASPRVPRRPPGVKAVAALVALGIGLLTVGDSRPSESRWAPAPRTVLRSDFTEAPLGALSPSQFREVLADYSGSPDGLEDASIVEADGGDKAMRIRLDANTIRTRPQGNNGIVVIAPLPLPLLNACLSYDVRFDRDFDWSLGGKLPGLLGVAPGVSPGLPAGGHPAGSLGWSGRIMWRGSEAFPTRGRRNVAVSYVYSPQLSQEYGSSYSWKRGFVAGRWHHVEQCYRMNTIGERDGVMSGRLDGRRTLLRRDYLFRTRPDVAISHLAWSVFRGGNSMDWAGRRPGTVDLRNVRVTTD